MRPNESRSVVLDVVASAASGMPVYYSVPDTITRDENLLAMEPQPAAHSVGLLQALRSFVRTHLAVAPRGSGRTERVG
jgi:hypothetical protein